MSSSGWIKLHRQIMDNPIWDDGAPFDRAHAWIDLLMLASHADHTKIVSGNVIHIKRGQAFVSDKFLADRWHWSRNRVRRFVRDMVSLKMLTSNSTGVGTWLTVENYDKFQNRWTGVDTGNGTGSDTTDGTPYDTTGDTQYKNVKNVKTVKNGKREGQAPHPFSPPSIEDIQDYCSEMGYAIDPELFVAYYDARDWCLSKGKKMTNWQSAVTAWGKRERKDADHATQSVADSEQTSELIEHYKQREAESTEPPVDMTEQLRKRLYR